MKKVAVLGGNGFLGTHLCARLKAEGYYVAAFGRHYPAYGFKPADVYNIQNLVVPFRFHDNFDEVYALAGEVGGLGYIQDSDNDAVVMHNSVQINLNVLEAVRKAGIPKVFFASSACVYPDLYQAANVEYDLVEHPPSSDGRTPEAAAYPANPINAFGWEKLFAERLYDAYARKHGIQVRIARFGNTYGPYCAWQGDRAKVVASICRKVAQVRYAEPIEAWGDGLQTRSFTYVDDAIEGIMRLMASDFAGPVNIGSSELVSIGALIDVVAAAAGKVVGVRYIEGPVGVQGRTSDNTLIQQKLGWEPRISLEEGIRKTYPWIKSMVDNAEIKDTITS